MRVNISMHIFTIQQFFIGLIIGYILAVSYRRPRACTAGILDRDCEISGFSNVRLFLSACREIVTAGTGGTCARPQMKTSQTKSESNHVTLTSVTATAGQKKNGMTYGEKHRRTAFVVEAFRT